MTITYEDYIEKQREEGKIEGKIEGRLELAQVIAKIDGIKKAVQVSGFTEKEIETGQILPSK